MEKMVDGMRTGEGRRKYSMLCKRCGYKYKVIVMKKPSWEICNCCGYSAPFEDFELTEDSNAIK